MFNAIPELLTEAITGYSFKISYISKKTGISVSTLNRWKQGRISSDVSRQEKLEQFLNKLLADQKSKGIISKINEPRKNFLIPAMLRLCINENYATLPVFNAEKRPAGAIIKENGLVELYVDYIHSSFLGEIDGAVDVVGDSMKPTFNQGAKIVISRLKYPDLLHPGKPYYFIDRSCQSFIRRMRYSNKKDTIILYSDRPRKYPAMERKHREFLAVFRIKGAINNIVYY